jgi:hypothetical protein
MPDWDLFGQPEHDVAYDQRVAWQPCPLRERVHPRLCSVCPPGPGFSLQHPETRALAPPTTSGSPAAAC